MIETLRIGALISGTGTNLKAILEAFENGTIAGKVVFAGTDNPDAAGLAHARSRGVPVFAVDYRAIIVQHRRDPRQAPLPDDFDLQDVLSKQRLFGPEAAPRRVAAFLAGRAMAEAALLKAMAAHPFDLLVLAGFMRTLTPYFIDRIAAGGDPAPILNIHPALLPAFPGTDGYGDTFRFGCKVAGCTVHFVDYGEDTGPIVGQRAFQILPGDTLEIVRKKGLAHEWALYPECIDLFARGRLKVVTRAVKGRDGREKNRRVVEILPR
jgi:phosphoribosylglycinamide formyltransferase-1